MIFKGEGGGEVVILFYAEKGFKNDVVHLYKRNNIYPAPYTYVMYRRVSVQYVYVTVYRMEAMYKMNI